LREGKREMAKEVSDTDWTEVAAKAQAYQALHLAGLMEKDKRVTDRAEFLMALGISRSDAARLIGSTDESLRKGFEALVRKRSSKPGKDSSSGE
jgi:hypothetical protein